MPKIRPIKNGDFEHIYGYAPPRTIRGYTAESKGLPIAVAGIYFMPDHIVAFCNVTPEAQRQRHLMACGFRKFARLLKEQKVPVYAIADPSIPTSENFLMRCGFTYLNKGPNGEVFICKP